MINEKERLIKSITDAEQHREMLLNLLDESQSDHYIGLAVSFFEAYGVTVETAMSWLEKIDKRAEVYGPLKNLAEGLGEYINDKSPFGYLKMQEGLAGLGGMDVNETVLGQLQALDPDEDKLERFYNLVGTTTEFYKNSKVPRVPGMKFGDVSAGLSLEKSFNDLQSSVKDFKGQMDHREYLELKQKEELDKIDGFINKQREKLHEIESISPEAFDALHGSISESIAKVRANIGN